MHRNKGKILIKQLKKMTLKQTVQDKLFKNMHLNQQMQTDTLIQTNQLITSLETMMKIIQYIKEKKVFHIFLKKNYNY